MEKLLLGKMFSRYSCGFCPGMVDGWERSVVVFLGGFANRF